MTKPQHLITLWQNAPKSEDIRYFYSSIHPDAKGEKFIEAVRCFVEMHVNDWPDALSKRRVTQIVNELLDEGIVHILDGKIVQCGELEKACGRGCVLRLVKQVSYKIKRR